jgi:hypothetical protein
MDHQKAIFFIEQLRDSDSKKFFSSASQLFQYLEENAKDNSQFIKYKSEIEKWNGWLEKAYKSSWSVPTNFEEAKSLSFYLYHFITREIDKSRNLIFLLFRNPDINDNLIKFNHTFLEYFNKSMEDIFRADIKPSQESTEKILGNNIFIIHGHDNEMKREVQLFLERCDLDGIVLHECPNKNRTVIDKLIGEGQGANYVIALLSPDDELVNGQTRARQNVILEIGYFLGLLGKDRVNMLKRGNVEIPSDLQGILYTEYDEAGAWKMKLVKELRAVGINVNDKKVIDKF